MSRRMWKDLKAEYFKFHKRNVKKKLIVYSYCVNKVFSLIWYTDFHYKEGQKSCSVNAKGVGAFIPPSSIVLFKTD
jgi:hypothetical protein